MSSVIVGVDGSANSIAALQWAARYAKSTDGIVHAVYVWSYPISSIAPAPLGSPVAPAELMTISTRSFVFGWPARVAVALIAPPPIWLLEKITHDEGPSPLNWIASMLTMVEL